MAKKSAIENNEKKRRMVKKYAGRRERLKKMAQDESLSMEERFEAQLKLAALPRNSSATRIRNRCEVTGRPRAYLPQAEDVPYRPARTGIEGPCARSCEVQLVGGAP